MAQLEIARRLYQALVAQDPNRVIILCTSTGKVLARHDLRHEQSDPSLPHSDTPPRTKSCKVVQKAV